MRQYLGKYVVIDIWATWCSPCLYNAPYFYDFAEKYKDKNVQFIAISTDANVQAWKAKKTKNKHVVNWISSFSHPFFEYFAIQSIPRYILIDPQGHVIQHDMPQPSTTHFEDYLKNNIK